MSSPKSRGTCHHRDSIKWPVNSIFASRIGFTFETNHKGATQTNQIVNFLVLVTLTIAIEMVNAAPIKDGRVYERNGCGTEGSNTCGKGWMFSPWNSLKAGVIL